MDATRFQILVTEACDSLEFMECEKIEMVQAVFFPSPHYYRQKLPKRIF